MNGETDEEIRAAARDEYQTDDVQIPHNADVERVSGGYWVSAQVWVYAND